MSSLFDLNCPLIRIIPDVLMASECAAWIERIRAEGPTPATINTYRGPRLNREVRDNLRVILDDEEAADQLFQRVKDQVPETIHGMSLLGMNERLRCYEYRVGHRFAPHMDGAYFRDENEQSWYTVLIYLNEEFEGGETVFFVEPEKSVKPETGRGLIFQHPILHEGAKVTKGVKYMLRSDLMHCKAAP